MRLAIIRQPVRQMSFQFALEKGAGQIVTDRYPVPQDIAIQLRFSASIGYVLASSAENHGNPMPAEDLVRNVCSLQAGGRCDQHGVGIASRIGTTSMPRRSSQ